MKKIRLEKETAILAMPAGILSGGIIGAIAGAFCGKAGLWFCLGSAIGAAAGFSGCLVLFLLWLVKSRRKKRHAWKDV